MPRKKALANNNNAGEVEEKKVKPTRKRHAGFSLQLPKRRQIAGHVLVCGNGETGQLGLGEDIFERKRLAIVEELPDAVDVVAGGMHCLVLNNVGEVYSFGCNDEGALGRDTSADGSESLPARVDLPDKVLCISAGDSHSACLLEDGSVYAWGSFRDSHGNMGLTNDGNKRRPIHLMAGVACCSIASGADHLAILTCSGKLFTVGCAEQGQLGRISERSVSGEGRRGKLDLLRLKQVFLKRGKPIEAIWATNYCTFWRESTTDIVWAVGLNNYKQLAYDKDVDRVLTPIKTTLKDVKQIAGGQHHTLLLKTDNSCSAVGRADYGRLGLGERKEVVGSLTYIQSLAKEQISWIACGEACSYAVTDDGKLYTWGMGSNNQLGVGDGDDEMEPVHVVSKNTQNKKLLLASGGGQHSIFLCEAEPKEEIVPKKAEKSKSVTSTAAVAAAAAATVTDESVVHKDDSEANKNGPKSTLETTDEVQEPPAKRSRKKK